MKTISLKNLCATASLLVGLGGMSSAQADVYNAALAAVPSATDVYGLTCPIGTVSAQANVMDPVADGIILSVQVVNPQGSATRATAPSPGASVQVGLFGAGPGGPGSYLVLVNKGQAGAQPYQLFLDCFNAGGPLALIQSTLVQDQ